MDRKRLEEDKQLSKLMFLRSEELKKEKPNWKKLFEIEKNLNEKIVDEAYKERYYKDWDDVVGQVKITQRAKLDYMLKNVVLTRIKKIKNSIENWSHYNKDTQDKRKQVIYFYHNEVKKLGLEIRNYLEEVFEENKEHQPNHKEDDPISQIRGVGIEINQGDEKW